MRVFMINYINEMALVIRGKPFLADLYIEYVRIFLSNLKTKPNHHKAIFTILLLKTKMYLCVTKKDYSMNLSESQTAPNSFKR